MTQIIAISGKKNAGKSTVAKFLLVRQLKRHGAIHDFEITDDGTVIVSVYDETNNEVLRGVVDFTRVDEEFLLELFNNVWPLGRITSNAEELKRFLVDIMEVQPKLIYGTKEEKLGKTQYKWRQMPIPPGKRAVPRPETSLLDDFLTGREIMQYWGQLFRDIDPNFHTNKVLTTIRLLNPKQAYVDDVRYISEIETYLHEGAKIIRLTRGDDDDDHESEKELDNYDFVPASAAIIDNVNLTLAETLEKVNEKMDEWGL